MRLIKMFGLAALVAVAAMALVGASSAAASGSTSLCKIHQDPCEAANRVTTIHMVNVGNPILLGVAFGVHVSVLCLESLATGTVEGTGLSASGQPLGVTITALTWAKCGTNAAHNNCNVKTLINGLFDVLKTFLNLGTAAALNTVVLVECNLGILGTIHCDYGGTEVKGFVVEGAGHNGGLAGNGMFTATKLAVPIKEALTGVCPSKSEWTALYEPLSPIYGVS